MKTGDTEYTHGEITYIIELSSALCQVDEIQELFYKFTNQQKRISGSTVQQIQLKHADRIARQREVYLNNIQGNPLAHLRIRLDIAYKVLRDCLEEKPSHTIKTGDNEYTTVYKKDNMTVLKVLQHVMQDLAKQEEIEAERAKIVKPEDSEWDIADGLAG